MLLGTADKMCDEWSTFIIFPIIFLNFLLSSEAVEVNCSTLRLGQYLCLPLDIDPATQQIAGCNPKNQAEITCIAGDEITCLESGNSSFTMTVPCQYTNGYSFETTLLLSIFLGAFGVDRFYLGYPAAGLFKLCTCGFMFLGQLLDIILIATQVVLPADGSNYIISYFGPRLEKATVTNGTYRLPQADWF